MNDIVASLSPFQTFRYFFRQMAPLFWGVSIMPFYIGWSLAARRIYPTSPSTEIIFFILGLLAVGPFLGGATILYNDYYDKSTDKHSRRKKNLPLMIGLLSPESVHRLAIALFVIAFILSLFVSLLFALFISICILLSLIYSAPPLRLKERSGLDLLTNILGSGVICSIAGWIIVKPIAEFPFFWILVPILGVGAIYMPTTIIDYDPDVKEGVKTIATYLGKKKAFYLGITFVILVNCVIIAMAISNYIISPKFILFTWPLVVIEIITYWYCLRNLDFKGGYYAILTFSILAAIGNGLILLYHAGYLILP